MPQIMAFLPLITAVAGPLLGKALGGGEKAEKEKGGGAAAATPAAAAARRLFTPDQVTQATDRYGSSAKAKWGQILSGMGAGGGTGVDPTQEIGSQATRMAAQLGGLTTDSGYGDNPMANLDAILKGVEGGINPKYAAY